MSILSKLKEAFTTPAGNSPARPSNVRRINFFKRLTESAHSYGGYSGGKTDRITEEWRPGTIGPNRAFQMDGRLLRERAWDLYHNNPFAASAVNAYIANVIESGIVPERTETWERAWQRWCGQTVHGVNECDITRDQTMHGLQELWLTEVICGGGCLVHYVKVSRRSQSVPLAIELIGEDMFCDELQWYGQNPKTRNPVHNGIEIDPATGRTIAYHVKRYQPNDLHFEPLESRRLLVENCEYAYLKRRVGSKRGTTALRSSIIWLWALGYYTDNELKNSDVKSSWAYMIKTSESADIDWADLADSDPETGTTDVYGNVIEKLEPQSIFRGFPGDEISAVGPNVPGSDSLPWIQLIQRSIAVGVGVSYEEMFRDYTKGSFSAVRAAMASDRKRFRPLQSFAIHQFGNPTVRRFDDAAVANFTDGFPSPAQWERERDDVWAMQEWSVPGWESPNPKDDAQADDVRLRNGTATYQGVLGRMGKSWRKHFAQREIEKQTPGYPDIDAQPRPGAAAPQSQPSEADE